MMPRSKKKTIEQDLKRKVNVKKVVKAVKNIGSFALYSKSKDCTLLITSYFIIMPGVFLDKKNISIEVKSIQNYKSEWESANFRGTVVVLGALT